MLTYPLTLARAKGKAFGKTYGIKHAERETNTLVSNRARVICARQEWNGARRVWKREFLYVAGNVFLTGKHSACAYLKAPFPFEMHKSCGKPRWWTVFCTFGSKWSYCVRYRGEWCDRPLVIAKRKSNSRYYILPLKNVDISVGSYTLVLVTVKMVFLSKARSHAVYEIVCRFGLYQWTW